MATSKKTVGAWALLLGSGPAWKMLEALAVFDSLISLAQRTSAEGFWGAVAGWGWVFPTALGLVWLLWNRLRSQETPHKKRNAARQFEQSIPAVAVQEPSEPSHGLSMEEKATIEKLRVLYRRAAKEAQSQILILLERIQVDLRGRNFLTRLLWVPIRDLKATNASLSEALRDDSTVASSEVQDRFATFFEHYMDAVRFVHESQAAGIVLGDNPYRSRYDKWEQAHGSLMERLADLLVQSDFRVLETQIRDIRSDLYFFDTTTTHADRSVTGSTRARLERLAQEGDALLSKDYATAQTAEDGCREWFQETATVLKQVTGPSPVYLPMPVVNVMGTADDVRREIRRRVAELRGAVTPSVRDTEGPRRLEAE